VQDFSRSPASLIRVTMSAFVVPMVDPTEMMIITAAKDASQA
jgi:hypothetical protein